MNAHPARNAVFIVVAGVGLAVAAALTVLLLLREPPTAVVKTIPGFDEVRTIQYSFTVKNERPDALSGSVLSLYAPVPDTSHQRVESITVSHEHQVRVDDVGNTVLDFLLPDLAPFESRIITVRARLSVSEISRPHAVDAIERYLASEPYVEIEHPALRRLAGAFSGREKADLAEAAYRWVVGYLQAEDFIEDDRGALWALENRRGDCTEFMYLYMALARLHGIPVRGVGGYVVSESQVVRSPGYHNWAEIHVDGAWHVVDPLRRVFMSQQADYIALRIIKPPENSLLGVSHRYAYQGRGLAVTMN
ncbi:MAG: transglutaminase domain-containing protein [Aquisalimonadaceae bacterium]